MSFDPILAIIVLIFGILVIAFEDLLNWIVGIFFILVGLWLLYDYFTKGSGRYTSGQQRERPPEQER